MRACAALRAQGAQLDSSSAQAGRVMLSPGGLAAGGSLRLGHGGQHAQQLRRSLRRPGCARIPLVWSASAVIRGALPRRAGAAAAAVAAACCAPRALVVQHRAIAARASGPQHAGVFAARAGYDSGNESDGERSGSGVGITMSQLLERHRRVALRSACASGRSSYAFVRVALPVALPAARQPWLCEKRHLNPIAFCAYA